MFCAFIAKGVGSIPGPWSSACRVVQTQSKENNVLRFCGRQCPSLDTGPSGVPGCVGHGPITLIPWGRAAGLPSLFWLNCKSSILHVGRHTGNLKCPGPFRQGACLWSAPSQNSDSWSWKGPLPFRWDSQVTSLMGVDCDSATGSFRGELCITVPLFESSSFHETAFYRLLSNLILWQLK